MKSRSAICGAMFVIVGGTTLQAQERPTNSPGTLPDTGRASAVRDTLPADTAGGERLVIDGDFASELPLDRTSDLLRLLPGFSRRSDDLIYRANSARVLTYVDGVPVRRTGSGAAGIMPPLNALARVSLLGGGMPASRVGATAVELTTLKGGESWTLETAAQSDVLSPADSRQYLTRFDLQSGGPVPGVAGLRLAVAGHLTGQRYRQLPGRGQMYLASGIDTTFVLAGTSGDVEVVVPSFEPVDFNRLPIGNGDRTDVTAGLTYDRRGAEYAVRYYRSSNQEVGRELQHIYNPDAWRGVEDLAQVASLSLHQPLPLGLTGDLVLSHQRYENTSGVLPASWASSNSQPALGITTGSLAFTADRDNWPVTDVLVLGLRSGIVPPDAIHLTTQTSQLGVLRQGVRGISQSLRLNPFGAHSGLPISGAFTAGEGALSWETERTWYGRASVSKQFGKHTLEIGGESNRSRVEGFTLPLIPGTPDAFREQADWSAGYVQAAISMASIRLGGGVRLEHHSSNALLPRVPGFLWNVPDSLRGDAYTLRAGDEPWDQRIERVVDCGGAATAANRTNSAGQVVCMNNFLPVAGHTAISPRFAIEYGGNGRVSARASYGSYVQPQSLLSPGVLDLSAGFGNEPQPLNTEPVRENIAEAGARFRTSRGSWVDVQLFRVDVSNPVVTRRVPYVTPTGGVEHHTLVRVNGDSEVTTGVELTALQHVTSWSGLLATVGLSRSGVENFGGGARTDTDPIRASGVLWLDLGNSGAPRALAPVLNDLTLYATGSYAGGGRYSRFVNRGEGHLAGRLSSGTFGELAGQLNSSRLPARKEFDLRVARSFGIAGINARIIADLRNVLGFENVHTVFSETGTTENDLYRQRQAAESLLVYAGTGSVSDMVIDEWPENELNRHMLRRAEQRFGNGDGVYTIAEMQAAVNAQRDLMSGPQWLRDEGREVRLGVELGF